MQVLAKKFFRANKGALIFNGLGSIFFLPLVGRMGHMGQTGARGGTARDRSGKTAGTKRGAGTKMAAQPRKCTGARAGLKRIARPSVPACAMLRQAHEGTNEKFLNYLVRWIVCFLSGPVEMSVIGTCSAFSSSSI
jgi:hypothetical protein